MSSCYSVPGPDEFDGRCPTCREKGRKVQKVTMEHLLRPASRSSISSGQYFFCENRACEALYFSSPGSRAFLKGEAVVRIGLKETEDPIPLCYCFGYTRKMAWDEIARTGGTDIPDTIRAEIQAGNCACEIKNPSGACCLAEIHRTVQEGLEMLAPSQAKR